MFMGFTYQEQTRIESLYKKLRNAAAVAREVNSGIDRVREHLKSKGYKLNHGGKRISTNGGRGALSDREVRKVLKLYNTFDGCTGCASKDSYTDDTYKKYWELGGLQIRNHREAHKSRVVLTNKGLENAYIRYKKSLSGNIRTKPKQNTTISHKRNDRRYTGIETKLRIVSAYIRYDGNSEQASKSMSYCREKISKCWTEARRETKHAYILYRGNSIRAARELGYPETVILRLWQEANLSSERPSNFLRRRYLEYRL